MEQSQWVQYEGRRRASIAHRLHWGYWMGTTFWQPERHHENFSTQVGLVTEFQYSSLQAQTKGPKPRGGSALAV